MTICLRQDEVQSEAGILVVDRRRKMVSLNWRFVQMWNIPQNLIVSQDEKQALTLASACVENSKEFIEKIEQIYACNELEIHDTIKLKDGQVFERYSLPQYLESKNVGRIWVFHHIKRVTKSKSCVSELRRCILTLTKIL